VAFAAEQWKFLRQVLQLQWLRAPVRAQELRLAC
jgi:hypothetical protein